MNYSKTNQDRGPFRLLVVFLAHGIPSQVSRYNIEKLRRVVKNGPDVHPGANQARNGLVAPIAIVSGAVRRFRNKVSDFFLFLGTTGHPVATT